MNKWIPTKNNLLCWLWKAGNG